jgi:hypothetical protein
MAIPAWHFGYRGRRRCDKQGQRNYGPENNEGTAFGVEG